MKTETRALLLTDVVDSTKLAARIGDAQMAALWAAHDRVARDLLPQFGGREIDKTDGMLLMFDAAPAAVAYAVAYQRGLAELPTPLAARAGLHVGPVILRENSAEDVARGAKPIEVDGLAKPTAARVMSMALGGQILLTPEARAELGEQGGWKTASHGHWALKGLTDPVEIFEVGDEQTRFATPPEADKAHRVVKSGERWVPVSDLPNNLPPQRSSFVGRERELTEIKELLDEAQLVTVLGMGGLGKTRLTLQVAAELLPRYTDGAWFIDLSAVTDPALVVGTAARTFGIFEEPGRPLVQTVCAWLKSKRLLMVLDNCEHLVASVAEFADTVLGFAPNVQMLASSRELLDVPGEQQYPIHPLPLPPKEAGLETLLESAAVRMFAERAKAQRPSFKLEEQDPAQLAELVTRLEGIPLAIELAAARLRTLAIPEILQGLEDRYEFLAGGSRVLQRRQQTLRALVDWSYDMLEDDEKRVLARLSVFAGGFDRDAAVAVCADEAVPAKRVPDILASLVQKSLAWRESEQVEARYRMLETIRDYAAEKLGQSEDVSAVAAKHCMHFFALAKEAGRGMHGAEQRRWVRRLDVELDNLRVAMTSALSGKVDPMVAVKLPVALWGFWQLRGYASEGRRVVADALAMPAIAGSDLARAWALYVGGALSFYQGDHAEATLQLEACLELRRRLGDSVLIAGALSELSQTKRLAGDLDGAVANATEALDIFASAGDQFGEAIGWLNLAQIRVWVGEGEAAIPSIERALELARATSNRKIEAEAELALAEAHAVVGCTGKAREAVERSLKVCRDAGDQRGEAVAGWWQGRMALESGELGGARRSLESALRAFRRFEMRPQVLGCLEDLALQFGAEGMPAAALELASATEQARLHLVLRRSSWEDERWRSRLRELWMRLPDDIAESAHESGKQWEIDQAIRAVLEEGKARSERMGSNVE